MKKEPTVDLSNYDTEYLKMFTLVVENSTNYTQQQLHYSIAILILLVIIACLLQSLIPLVICIFMACLYGLSIVKVWLDYDSHKLLYKACMAEQRRRGC